LKSEDRSQKSEVLSSELCPLSSVIERDKITMLGVLFGQGEVLVIIIITVVVVFVLVRRRKRK